MLRHVGDDHATVWVETTAPCTVAVAGRRSDTFEVRGHHYAVVVVDGLEPGASLEYTVELDGRQCWPAPGDPPSVLRTPRRDGSVTVVFGSCRRCAPEEPPWGEPIDAHPEGLGPDALRELARSCRSGEQPLPDVLVLAGDQIYSDLPSPSTVGFIERTRSLAAGPAETTTYEEFAAEYRAAWSDPGVRWLLANVASAMVFDDHEVLNGWNSSQAWVEEMRDDPSWPGRATAAFVAYWVYQHLGNLSPGERDGDRVWTDVSSGDRDPHDVIATAVAPTAHLSSDRPLRWSFRWDVGGVRLVVVDSRSARVLAEGARDVLPPDDWQWLEEELCPGDGALANRHLAVVSSVPVLLPRMIHDVELWSDRLGAGVWGRPGRALAHRLRDALGLEHWPAFPRAFDRLLGMVDRSAGATSARPSTTGPATVLLVSGEVHYSYLAELDTADVPVWQLVSSPLRNPSTRRLRGMHRLSTTRVGAVVGRVLARSVGVPAPAWRWNLRGGPWFGNTYATARFERSGVQVELVSTDGEAIGAGATFGEVARVRIGARLSAADAPR